MAKKKKATKRKPANRNATLIAAINRHAEALESHAAILTAHTIALTPSDARGACTIIFTDGRQDYCVNNKTNRQCQDIGAEMNGTARPVIPGRKCFVE
jgi:hypothetical protein